MPAAEPCSPEPCCRQCSQGAIITHGPSTFPKAEEAFGCPASSVPLSSDQLVQVLQQTHSLLFSCSRQRTSPLYIDLFPWHPREQLAADKEEGDPLPGVVTALHPGGTDLRGDGHPSQSLMPLLGISRPHKKKIKGKKTHAGSALFYFAKQDVSVSFPGKIHAVLKCF